MYNNSSHLFVNNKRNKSNFKLYSSILLFVLIIVSVSYTHLSIIKSILFIKESNSIKSSIFITSLLFMFLTFVLTLSCDFSNSFLNVLALSFNSDCIFS